MALNEVIEEFVALTTELGMDFTTHETETKSCVLTLHCENVGELEYTGGSERDAVMKAFADLCSFDFRTNKVEAFFAPS